jgi:threonylcarbamoyladenosine tRNA methylthiotransferase MtaB
MPGQILNAEKESRAHRAGAVAAEMEREYLSTFVGETVEVLFEENKNGRWRGYTTRYVEVTANSEENLHNQFRTVRITAAEGGKLVGELV